MPNRRSTSNRMGNSAALICCAALALMPAAAFAARRPATQPAPAAELACAPASPISGSIYEDTNGNGRRDADEPPIPGVGVSDGVDLMLSGNDGGYTLPGRGAGMGLVYISIPSGYAKTTTWFRHLNGTTAGMDFGLRRAVEDGTFDFVQVTDLHISQKTTREIYAQTLAEIARMPKKPAMVVATGDLVNSGESRKQYEDLVAALATSKVPVFNVPGNHDQVKGSYAQWREFLGPEHYSFDCGNVHFLSINSIRKTPEQDAWIAQDLKLFRGKKKLLIFQHTFPTQEEHDLFLSWHADAVFSGHWHNQHTVNIQGMRSYNSPTSLFGGIDCSPAGFKVVSMTPEGISSRMRFLANGKRLQIVSPGTTGLVMSQGPIVVNAYETSADVMEVRYEVKRGQEVVASGTLKNEGDWSWTGELPELSRDNYHMIATATNHRGETSTATADFIVVAGRPAVKLGKDWPQFGGGPKRGSVAEGATIKPPLAVAWTAATGGTIDFASTVLKSGSVYLGVKDRGDFEHNGVLALDAATGAKQWFAPTPAAVSHSVAVDDARVYASSHGGTVHVLDRLTGKPVYVTTLGSASQRFLYGGPVLLGDRMFAGTAGYFAEIDASSGNEKWHSTYGSDWIGGNAAPATDGKLVVFGANWQAKSLRAISAADGKLVWDYPCKGLHGSPVLAGDRVVFTTHDGKLAAVALADGKKLWSVSLLASRNATDTDAKDAAAPLDHGLVASASTPAVSGDVVVAGGTGNLRAVRLSNGEELWQVPLQQSAFKMSPYDTTYSALAGSATIAGNTVWAPCGDGRLYALELATGKVQWTMDFGAPIISAPCISGNTLFLTGYDGTVYALVSAE